MRGKVISGTTNITSNIKGRLVFKKIFPRISSSGVLTEHIVIVLIFTYSHLYRMALRAGSVDEGFINSEWSLMFMLRVGLIGLQLLPDTSQPSKYNSICLHNQ